MQADWAWHDANKPFKIKNARRVCHSKVYISLREWKSVLFRTLPVPFPRWNEYTYKRASFFSRLGVSWINCINLNDWQTDFQLEIDNPACKLCPRFGKLRENLSNLPFLPPLRVCKMNRWWVYLWQSEVSYECMLCTLLWRGMRLQGLKAT